MRTWVERVAQHGEASVSRMRCSAQRCTADPGPFQEAVCVTVPVLQRITPQEASCCAAPGTRTTAHVQHHAQDPKVRDCRLIPIHTVKQPPIACRAEHRPAPASKPQLSVPVAPRTSRPGSEPSSFISHPPRGRRSADRRVFLVVVPRGSGAARTLRSVRSPLGAPPWRFLVPGSPRVPSGSTGPVAQASPHQPLWPGRRCRASEAAVANPRSRTPHPLRHQDRLRRRPSSSEILHTILDAIRSQYISSNCAENGWRRSYPPERPCAAAPAGCGAANFGMTAV